MNTTAELIVFDCDGVLLDSELLAGEVLLDYCRARFPGLDFAPWRQHMFGVATRDIFAGIAAEYGVEFPADADQQVLTDLDRRLRGEVQAVSGVAAALSELKPPKAVASNSHTRYLHELLGQVGLLDFFDRLHGVDQVERGKPAPDIYLHAARSAGAEPERCLAIEDSVTGVQAAVAAGMRVVGFIGASHSGGHMAGRLRAAGAFRVLDDLRGLPRLLG